MAVIACLVLPPTEAVCDVGAQLTPVVQPLSDCILMDWTGSGSVPQLAQRLAKKLRALAKDPKGRTAVPQDYRLGVGPVRFAAEALARFFKEDPPPKGDDNAPIPIAGGFYVPPFKLADFVDRLPIAWLPDIDEEAKRTLAALAVHTLGAAGRIQPSLLRAHIGPAADTLRAWAQGQDARTVAALYPPAGQRTSIDGEALLDALQAGARPFADLVAQAVAPLASQWHNTGDAVRRVAVHWAGQRRVRTFLDPVADPARLTRTVTVMASALLAETTRQRLDVDEMPASFSPAASVPRDDFTIEMTPAKRPHFAATAQLTLWQGKSPRNTRQMRLQKAMDGLRHRFGDIIGFAAPKEAVARYEAMLHLYRAEG